MEKRYNYIQTGTAGELYDLMVQNDFPPMSNAYYDNLILKLKEIEKEYKNLLLETYVDLLQKSNR